MSEESPESLDPIVELQALELARLLRDNNRLNQRIDFLVGEIKWLRQLQQRELALRESEQAMHRAAQDTIKGLIATADGVPAARPAETGNAGDSEAHQDQAATDMVLAECLVGFAEQPAIQETAQTGPAEPEPADEEPELPAFLTAGADTSFEQIVASDPADRGENGWDGDTATAPAAPTAPEPSRNKRFGLWSGRLGRSQAAPENSAVSGGD